MNPRLRIVARTVADFEGIEKFLEDFDTTWRTEPQAASPEAIVEFAGRVCYMSFGTSQSQRSNAEYIENLIRQGHESVLEHASWTFVLSGVSRSFSHQFVRHRVGFSVSQLSQQYVDHDQIDFVEPFDPSAHPEAALHWQRAINSIREAYRNIRDILQKEGSQNVFSSNKEFSRFVRSAARSILPNASETRLVFTANARALRHFLRVRGSVEGDVEMRLVAAELLRLVQEEAPPLFVDFSLTSFEDGTPLVKWSPPSAALQPS